MYRWWAVWVGVAIVLAARSAVAHDRLMRRIGAQDGLSPQAIVALAQDERGFVWMGTSAGLHRYDGRTIRRWAPATVNTQPRWIRSAGNGVLFVSDELGSLFEVDAVHEAARPVLFEADRSTGSTTSRCSMASCGSRAPTGFATRERVQNIGLAVVLLIDTCQLASDTYGISAGVTFGFAPADVQSWWTTTGCSTHPSSSNACQAASELYGIADGISFGFAPSSVQTWWTSHGCHTQPSSQDTCQRASDTYGIVANVSFGFAPADVRSWWTSHGCNTQPR